MSIKFVKQVVRQGHSLAVNVTKECAALGIEKGEYVTITIEKYEPKKVVYDDEPADGYGLEMSLKGGY